MRNFIVEHGNSIILQTGDLDLNISKNDGCVHQIGIHKEDKTEIWESYTGDVSVRDDLLRNTFGRGQQSSVSFKILNDVLVIEKTFTDAPWILKESYRQDGAALLWESELSLESGEYRSCAISWNLPWPQPVFEISLWAPCGGMPTNLFRLAGRSFEYGETTSGMSIPALVIYNTTRDIGLGFSMPFDFKTPRFRYKMGFRDPDMAVEFDRLALSPKHSARTRLLLCGTCGHWRPALGRLYERYKDYFEPQSRNIDSLWGGHICGTFHEQESEVKDMKRLGIKWYEIHGHFAAYGNYHPEGMTEWRSGHFLDNTEMITVEKIQETIDILHKYGVSAFPYLQLNGDGDVGLLPKEMESSRIRNLRGDTWGGWPRTIMMNSCLDSPFGKDIDRQINGMLQRYPALDGIFLDQAGYNFEDTAHDDGISAIDNKPANMMGFSYFPHLKKLSQKIHPEKSIIANGAFGVGLIKYLDGFMNESDGEILETHQYYALGKKPIYLLVYDVDDAHIELMFQSALLHAAGFASYPKAMPSCDLFDMYMPLLKKLYRRRWIFDKDPIGVPAGFRANIFRGETGSLLIPLVRNFARIGGRETAREGTLRITVPGAEKFIACRLYQPGKTDVAMNVTMEKDSLILEIPTDMAAGLVELALPAE